MMFYRITAALLAPMAVQRNRQTNSPQTLPYLPGSSFRGAVAAKYLREGGHPEDDAFSAVFIDDPVIFPNLLPADPEGKIISQVLPLTCCSCKRHPGFKGQDGHGVSDLLAQKLVARYNNTGNEQKSCLDCGNDLKAITGFWNGQINAAVMCQPTMIYQRHTGIDRTTGTVAHKIFFTTQSMADFQKRSAVDGYDRQLLSGGTFINDKQLPLLEKLFQSPLFAGQDRTRGMGELVIAIDSTAIPLLDVNAWNRKFKAKLASLADGNVNQAHLSGCYFSLKLESHAILVDEFLRPTTELELNFPDVETLMKIVQAQRIRGWSDAWGLAKPDDNGIMMGSVYLFHYKGDDRKGLEQFLASLAADGVGLRRAEGFGRILACDPLHVWEEVI